MYISTWIYLRLAGSQTCFGLSTTVQFWESKGETYPITFACRYCTYTCIASSFTYHYNLIFKQCVPIGWLKDHAFARTNHVSASSATLILAINFLYRWRKHHFTFVKSKCTIHFYSLDNDIFLYVSYFAEGLFLANCLLLLLYLVMFFILWAFSLISLPRPRWGVYSQKSVRNFVNF